MLIRLVRIAGWYYGAMVGGRRLVYAAFGLAVLAGGAILVYNFVPVLTSYDPLGASSEITNEDATSLFAAAESHNLVTTVGEMQQVLAVCGITEGSYCELVDQLNRSGVYVDDELAADLVNGLKAKVIEHSYSNEIWLRCSRQLGEKSVSCDLNRSANPGAESEWSPLR